MDTRWMRVLAGLLLAVSLVVFCGCRGNRPDELIGQQAPNCTVTLLDGRSVGLKELRGKPVLLEFWAPWCGGCLQNIPPLKALHARFGKQVTMIAASSETGQKTMNRFVREHDIPYPVALSSQKLLDAFRVSVLPVTLLIDGQGIIRYHHAGQFSLPSMEGQINRLLATNRPPG